MKLFYINNSLCGGCDQCSVMCPAGAIYTRAGKRYITHDKCTSCGSCIRSCVHNAVSIESIDGMVERMENADLYLSRIRRLEKELAHLNERLEGALDDVKAVLESSPSAMAVCTDSGRIELSNSALRSLLPGQAGTGGASLTDLLPAGTVKTLLGNASQGESPGLNASLGGRPFYIRAVRMSGGNVLCTLCDLSDGPVASALVAGTLRRAVERNMEMVRRIATLLGDESSSMLNDINAALSLIEHAEPGNDPR